MPSYAIDLMDEARKQGQTDIQWRVFYEKKTSADSRGDRDPGGEPTFTATTEVNYREKPDDSFAFQMEFSPRKGRFRYFKVGILQIKEMTSLYRVNRAGQLLEMEAQFDFSLEKIKTDFRLKLEGRVENEKFYSSYRVQSPLLEEDLVQNLPTLKMNYQGSILQPLHPVNRIRGIRPGQTWTMPMINPLQDALKASQGWGQAEVQVEYVLARVSPKTQLLPDCEYSIPCYVIDYEDSRDMNPRTWVQVSTGLVLRQEATPLPGTRMIMQRKYLSDESKLDR